MLIYETALSSVLNCRFYHQIYRKAALKIVQDLGEDVFPEPAEVVTTSETKTVEKQDAPTNEPAAPETSSPAPGKETSTSSSSESSEDRVVTTVERKPLNVPDSVHVRISPENLKDYVGPPVYHKDRLYTTPPPPGVSSGLGYLGNGSGAVMPIEATVSVPSHEFYTSTYPDVVVSIDYAWEGWSPAYW